MSIEKLGQYLGAIEDPRCNGKSLPSGLTRGSSIACATSW
jgi:hypothetical protein